MFWDDSVQKVPNSLKCKKIKNSFFYGLPLCTTSFAVEFSSPYIIDLPLPRLLLLFGLFLAQTKLATPRALQWHIPRLAII
jgi:hypothetical protein